MQWSKLKQRLEERFANELKGRLHLFETIYRMGYNHRLGEIWVCLDKERIFSTSDFKGWALMSDLMKSGKTYDEAYLILEKDGSLPVSQSNATLFETLSMPIDEMLASHDVLVRGLAIADARFGKRRLASIKDDIKSEHDFIQRIFAERQRVESHL